MDAVMTSVGSTDPVQNPWILGAAAAADVPAAELRRSIVGNVGGLFLPRPDLGRDQQKLVDGVNARWTGIQRHHYAACSQRAAARGHGGTILVAVGDKAEIVLACVRAGLVAELLIDSKLASALCQELGVEFEP
jgi:hypothetical protein